MRSIAIGIMILAGAVMAAAGTIAESLPDARRYSIVDELGIGVVVLGCLLLVADLLGVGLPLKARSQEQDSGD